MLEENPIANITLNGGKLEAISMNPETTESCSLSPFLFNTVLEILKAKEGK